MSTKLISNTTQTEREHLETLIEIKRMSRRSLLDATKRKESYENYLLRKSNG